MYMDGGSPPEPGVGSLSRKRYTQYVEHNRKGHPWVPCHAQSLGNRLAATASTREKVTTGRVPIMEEALGCELGRALKSAYGRQNHHTPSGLRVCCESALKGAGELLSTRGLAAGAGAFGKQPPARGTVGVTGLAVSGDLAAGVKLLLANC